MSGLSTQRRTAVAVASSATEAVSSGSSERTDARVRARRTSANQPFQRSCCKSCCAYSDGVASVIFRIASVCAGSWL
jgi:hypothetical protein